MDIKEKHVQDNLQRIEARWKGVVAADVNYMLKLVKSLQQERDRYKGALEKYADMIVLDSEDHPHDVGHVAREVLSQSALKEE